MEPAAGAPIEQNAHGHAERTEDCADAQGHGSQPSEPFEASIVRLDQTAAEALFRQALD
ncbi:MAG TPA: hypothetical protein VF808_07380 [Ktedonobacterales bacterium]